MARMLPRRAIPVGAILLTLLASGRVGARPPTAIEWRSLIRQRDRDRLRDWRATWIAALANARANGAATRIAAEGVLLQPDAAIVPAEARDGDYRCRVIRLGATQVGGMSYAALPPTRCRLAAGRFAMLGGGQRPAGRVWPLDELRFVFLGAVALGDEAGALDYGRDPDRDMAGVLERIGSDRWRLVLPRPQWQSMLDVIEIAPAVSAPPPPRSSGG